MRGFLVGLVIVPVVMVTILSIRPGGIRRQLRNAARRLKLALVLAGVYLAGSAAIRVAAPNTQLEEWGLPALAVALAVIFVVLGQDPPLEKTS